MARAEFNTAAHRCGDILTGENDGHFPGRPDPAADRIIELYRDYHDAAQDPAKGFIVSAETIVPVSRGIGEEEPLADLRQRGVGALAVSFVTDRSRTR